MLRNATFIESNDAARIDVNTLGDDWVVTNLFFVIHWWTGIPKKSLVTWERHVCEALGFRLENQDQTFQAYEDALRAILIEDAEQTPSVDAFFFFTTYRTPQ